MLTFLSVRGTSVFQGTVEDIDMISHESYLLREKAHTQITTPRCTVLNATIKY